MTEIGFTNFGSGHELDGAAVFYDAQMLGQSLANGDWVAAGMFAATGVLDGVATAMDPFGSLIGAGGAWLIEHFEPLKGWLDDLAGDPGAILGQAGEMEGVAVAVTGIAADLRSRARTDLSDLDGEAITAYLDFNETLASGLDSLADSISGGAKAIETASSIVEMVRGVVRDAIAQLVGAAISWLAQAALSLGTATPWIISQVTTRVSALSARCSTTILHMTRSFDDLNRVIADGMVALREVGSRLRGYQPRHRAAPAAPDIPSIRPHLDKISPSDIIGSNAGSTAGNATNDGSDAQNERIDRDRAG